MKTSKQLHLLFVLFCGLSCMGLSTAEAAEDEARVQVILVQAGNGEGGVDKALRQYAGNLERLFRFKSYKQSSRQTLRLSVPGEGSVSLAGGQKLTIRSGGGSGSGLKAEISWKRGSKSLLNTRINLRRGSPAVLGGPRSKDGTWLLILQLK
ncbi:hypothetical protein G0Q06_11405 [Puniceicoccales bacterium CK1056]|uniref:Uncharacterized protein n=1 Tax=Oceanipulchritudo coccoides TaxID=2706888 RepID=A0A6B2M233_9BACT|nr:hypothetical protein [Oceanipulchritudo coccoides]NDV63061.1 hypothetical protein [Oceanipulchritudo coccoides]